MEGYKVTGLFVCESALSLSKKTQLLGGNKLAI